MPYIEVSAYMGEGLDEAMEIIRDLVLTSIDGDTSTTTNNAKLQRTTKLATFKGQSFSSARRDSEANTFEEWKQTRESQKCSSCS